MMKRYSSEVNSAVLSCHNGLSTYATVFAAHKAIFTSVILRALSSSLSCSLLYCLLFLIIVFCLLILLEELANKYRKRTYFDRSDSGRKLLEWIGYDDVVFILMYFSLACTVYIIYIEKLSPIIGILYGLLTCTFLFSLVQSFLNPPLTGGQFSNRRN